jgi:hypothetical protein
MTSNMLDRVIRQIVDILARPRTNIGMIHPSGEEMPLEGSRFNWTEKREMHIRANQKLGMETNIMDPTCTVESPQLYWWVAANAPRGMPNTTPMMTEPIARIMV